MSNLRRHTRLIASLAIVAMLVPAMVPRGYMPGVDPHSGAFSIVLCPASWTTFHESDHHDMGHHDGMDGDHPVSVDEMCPFAIASAPFAVSLEYPTSLIAGLPPLIIARAGTGYGQIHVGPPFPARGPPLPV